MKTTSINKLARMSGIAIALALFTGVAGEVRAQNGSKGGATLLMTPSAPASDYKPMSCGKCKDELVTSKDMTARGANKPDVTVARHLCDGCKTTITTVGHGKGKHDVATHKCTASGAPSAGCCSTKKDS
jgi:hypothetical protein